MLGVGVLAFVSVCLRVPRPFAVLFLPAYNPDFMFTGIIDRPVRVLSVHDHQGGRRLTFENSAHDLKSGESIAVSGACLTVTEFDDHSVSFDVIHETLAKTSLGQRVPGDRVNIERALKIGDRLDGHFVQGHVDATAELLERFDNPSDWRLRITLPPELADYLAPKGSVTLDGVSLTIAELTATWFEVALIPTTLGRTTLGDLAPGDLVNVEADILGKTVVNFLRRTR